MSTTRLGLGGPGRNYTRPIAAKAENLGDPITIRENTRYEVFIRQHGNTFVQTEIVFTGADFGLIDT